MTAPDVAAALASALEAIEDERATHQAMLVRLAALAKAAVRFFDAGAMAECHTTCKEALDLAHLALGECDAFDPLVGLLGYEGPEPDEGTVLS